MRIFTNWVLLILCLFSCGSLLQANERKVVLITGASRGIGFATAQRLADEGYCVYATARNIVSLDFKKNKDIHVEELDVTDESEEPN